MNLQESKLIHSASLAIASLMAVVVAFYALTLLVVGEKITIVPESPIEEINKTDPVPMTMSIEYIPYPPAIIPLLAAVLLLAGLLGRNQLLAWIGLAILLVFSLLFLFSSGGILLPIAGLLLLLLPLINHMQKKILFQAETS